MDENVYHLKKIRYAQRISISLKKCRRILTEFDSLIFEWNGRMYDGEKMKQIIKARLEVGSIYLMPTDFKANFPRIKKA